MAEEKEKQSQETPKEETQQPVQEETPATPQDQATPAEDQAAGQDQTKEEPSHGSETEPATTSQEFFDTEVAALNAKEDSTAPADIGTRTLELLYDLELPVSVELARKELTIREILTLTEGAILEFDKMAGESVDILVNNKKIAEGEVVVVDDRFGVRITSLVEPGERIQLNEASK